MLCKDKIETTFRCFKCTRDLPKHEVWRSRNISGTLRQYCKACVNRPHWNRNKLMKYGAETTYDEQLEAQGRKCAICGLIKRLVIDHNHKTNTFRGLLCNSCNTALGMFQDSVEILTSAIAYLKKVDDDERIPSLSSNPDDNPSSCVRG